MRSQSMSAAALRVPTQAMKITKVKEHIGAIVTGIDLAQPIDDAVRIRPITDHVTEVPDGVHVACGCEHRVQGREVGMDVRQDRDPHAGRL
jgi:hypothetical protein